MDMVRDISDWVIVMAQGQIVAEGTPQSVMADQRVIDAYLGAHHDVDLGTLTGQQEIAETMDSDLVRHEIEEEAATAQPNAKKATK